MIRGDIMNKKDAGSPALVRVTTNQGYTNKGKIHFQDDVLVIYPAVSDHIFSQYGSGTAISKKIIYGAR